MSEHALSPHTPTDQPEQAPEPGFGFTRFQHPLRFREGSGLRVLLDGEPVATLLECSGERWIRDARDGWVRILRWWHIDSVGAGVDIGGMTRVVFRDRQDAAEAAYRVRLTHPDLQLDEYGLTGVERRMLALEAGRVPGWERYPTASYEHRVQAVLELFGGMRSLPYGQRLNQLIDNPGAVRVEPVTVNRLRRLRETRRAARSRHGSAAAPGLHTSTVVTTP